MLPFRADLFRIDRPGEDNLRRGSKLQSMLNLCGLSQKNKTMSLLRGEEGNHLMRQWFSARLFVCRIKDEAILQLSHDHHLGNGIVEPVLDLRDHVSHIRVDQAIKLIRTEPEPWHRLQKAIRAPIWAPACDDKLPEPEAHNLCVLSRPPKLPNEARPSILGNHSKSRTL